MALKIVGKRDAGSGLSEGHATASVSSIADLLIALRDELDDLRTQNAALLLKLDNDTGVTDTDHVATLSLKSATWKK